MREGNWGSTARCKGDPLPNPPCKTLLIYLNSVTFTVETARLVMRGS
jgi:hypothetical protein